MLIAIDTSTALTGIACYDQSGLLGEATWGSGRNHTVQVLPQITMLLHHLGQTTTDVRVVAVALGPGSWSGLRVGLSIAKGLAFAGGLKLIGVGTLDILACQHQYATIPVYPLIRLGRERFATARFQCDNQWKRIGDYRNVSLADLCREINDQVMFCGDIDSDVQKYLRRTLNKYVVFPHTTANMRRSGYLAHLAWQRFIAGDCDDIACLEPIYLGESLKITD